MRTETKAINNSLVLELNFFLKISSETSIFMLICNRTLLKKQLFMLQKSIKIWTDGGGEGGLANDLTYIYISHIF